MFSYINLLSKTKIWFILIFIKLVYLKNSFAASDQFDIDASQFDQIDKSSASWVTFIFVVVQLKNIILKNRKAFFELSNLEIRRTYK